MTKEHRWDRSAGERILPRNEVHVWCASLDQPVEVFQQLAQTLSEDERERAARFYFERDRIRYIVGRSILRTILGSYLGIAPDQLRFRYGVHGKPALVEIPGLSTIHFNVSHSEELALFAFAYEREVGIDIEHIRPMNDLEHIARRYFTAREYSTLNLLPPPEQPGTFFSFWTLKEALIKAMGDGLSRPLHELDIALETGKPAALLSIAGDAGEAARWSLQQLNLPFTGYSAALTVEGQNWQLACWQWMKNDF